MHHALLCAHGSEDDHQLAAKVARLANKSHKDRVNEFNSKLEALSEHHDIPKVRPRHERVSRFLMFGWRRLDLVNTRTDLSLPCICPISQWKRLLSRCYRHCPGMFVLRYVCRSLVPCLVGKTEGS